MTREPGTHPVNTAHLVMGMVFLGLCAVWAAVQTELVPTQDVRWLLPLPFLFAGGAGLLAFTVARFRRQEATVAPGTTTWPAEDSAPASGPAPEPDSGSGSGEEPTIVLREHR